MTLNCKPGDLAIIVRKSSGMNFVDNEAYSLGVGKIVRVTSLMPNMSVPIWFILEKIKVDLTAGEALVYGLPDAMLMPILGNTPKESIETHELITAS